MIKTDGRRLSIINGNNINDKKFSFKSRQIVIFINILFSILLYLRS